MGRAGVGEERRDASGLKHSSTTVSCQAQGQERIAGMLVPGAVTVAVVSALGNDTEPGPCGEVEMCGVAATVEVEG